MRLLTIALFVAITGSVLVPTNLRGDYWPLLVSNESSVPFKLTFPQDTYPVFGIEIMTNGKEWTIREGQVFTLYPGDKVTFKIGDRPFADLSLKCLRYYPGTKDSIERFADRDYPYPEGHFDGGIFPLVLKAGFSTPISFTLLGEERLVLESEVTGALLLGNSHACWAVVLNREDSPYASAEEVLENKDHHIIYHAQAYEIQGKKEAHSHEVGEGTEPAL
jgi:hypothetical protein